MLPPLCAWILVNGQPCNQPALRRRQFCRAHDKLARVEESNQELREMLDMISTIDIHNLVALTQHTLEEVIRHSMSPGRAHTILSAARDRLDVLLAANIVDDAPIQSPSSRPEAPARRSSGPAPAAIDLSALVSMIAELNRLNPTNSEPQKAGTVTNPIPAATSVLTPAK